MTNRISRFRTYLITAFLLIAGRSVSQVPYTDGELGFLLADQEYTVHPDPNDTAVISPVIGGKEYGQPAAFEIAGEPGALVSVSFQLPDSLGNTAGDSIPCSFGPASVYVEPGGAVWDADSAGVITLDDDGSALIYIGISVITPGTTPNTDYSAGIECTASYLPSNRGGTARAPLSTTSPAFYTVRRYPVAIFAGIGDLAVGSPGVTYILSPVPDNPMPVLPAGEGYPCEIEISGRPFTEARLEFLLPSNLVADIGGLIPCSFGAGSLWSPDSQALLDPSQPVLFRIGSGGATSFSLGMTMAVPPTIAGDASSSVICVLDDGVSADTAEGGFDAHIDFPLALSGAGGTVENLSPGHAYTLDPVPGDSVGVTPVITGSETGTPMAIEAEGSPGAVVLLSMVLPSVLADTVTGRDISCSFQPDGAYIEQWDSRSNPNEGILTMFDGNGICRIDLGVSVTIPDSAYEGKYRGEVLVQAEYVGGPSRSHISSIPLEPLMLEYSVQVGGATGIGSEESLPAEFTLLQNYPNPFNPGTKIRYGLPKESFVTLKVFNLLGQHVATLVEERREAGRYEVEFSPSGWPAGVYFYRLEADRFVQTKGLIFLK